MLNQFQRICAAVYAEGDFAHVQDLDGVRETGDALFTFLMVELGSGEDCDTQEEALRRLKMAIGDIEHVHDAIEQRDETSIGS